MSKKIIYLLSLLMALSLVFASCKKNNGLNPNNVGNQPPKEENNDNNTLENGLYGSSEAMKKDTDGKDAIRQDPLMNGQVSGNYHRNPVIVAGRDGAVFIFVEKRWERAGGENDIGIDGIGKVDIVYLTSKTSGKDNFQSSQTKVVGADAATAKDSHGAPIVYYIKDKNNDVTKDKIVVVASAGSGFGRTTAEILENTPSRVEYIVGTFTDKSTIKWGEWKPITTPNLSEEVAKIDTGNNGYTQTYKMQQFGTHSHRGVITTGNKLILPLVVAQQGIIGAGKELMGVYVLEGQLSNNDVNWSEPSSAVKVGYKGSSGRNTDYGQWKASEAVPTSTGYDVLTVPSPVGRDNNNTLGKHTGNGDVQLVNGLNASEGSFGYLLTDKWYGTGSYTADLTTGELSPVNGAASTQIIYTHVQSQESQLTLYLLNESRGNPKKIVLGATGKSSSVDMLPDGTVIIAAENTKDNQGYFLYYERYSQEQIMRLVGAQ